MDKIKYTDLFTDRTLEITVDNNRIVSQKILNGAPHENLFAGPGLTDLQVNGFHGVDFNTPPVSPEDILKVTEALIQKGVTTYFPTIITHADENMIAALECIATACDEFPLVRHCVGGVHLEGPFLSPDEGARGAHNAAFMRAPDWSLLEKFQDAAGGRIKIITLSPHWENSIPFIKKCVEAQIVVSIGHTNATPEQIKSAADAGATLSTHLGNAVPLMLPRHPNILWEQLADDALTATFIADGFHLPDTFIKVLLRAKGDKALLISDGTMFSGMTPGTYSTHIGGEIVLNENGRLHMKSNPKLLAGSARSLPDGVSYLILHNLATTKTAWTLASERPNKVMGLTPDDLVIFEQHNGIKIKKVFKSGNQVYTA